MKTSWILTAAGLCILAVAFLALSRSTQRSQSAVPDSALTEEPVMTAVEETPSTKAQPTAKSDSDDGSASTLEAPAAAPTETPEVIELELLDVPTVSKANGVEVDTQPDATDTQTGGLDVADADRVPDTTTTTPNNAATHQASAGNRTGALVARSESEPQLAATDSKDQDANWVDRWAVLADELEARNADIDKQQAKADASATPLTPATNRQLPRVKQGIDGMGGGLVTPMAYLLNPGPAGQLLGRPTLSTRFLRFGSKDMETVAVSETLLGRIELSYALARFGVGGLRDATQHALGRDIVRNDLYLHTWSLRGLLIEEDPNGWVPAVTAGVSFKYNDSIQTIDRRTGGALRDAGLDKSNGVDWTLTASKTLCEPWGNRPVTFTGGLRFSNAAQMGLLGFDNSCHLSVEGSVVYQPTDWLAVGYEMRYKTNPYDEIPGVLGDEDSLHAITADVMLNENLTLTAAWMLMGNVANGSGDCGWSIGLQYDF